LHFHHEPGFWTLTATSFGGIIGSVAIYVWAIKSGSEHIENAAS
jgi:hypothetical protein